MKTKITNAKIITCGDTVLENAEILFDENSIIAVGDRVGEADRVIDGSGKTVLPGFIDCHVHPAALAEVDEVTTALRVYHTCTEVLKSGVTTLRTTGTRHSADVTMRNMINSGELSGPRIKAAGKVICITCGHCPEIGIECDTVGETLKAVRSLCKLRVDWIKLMATSGVIGIGPATEVQLSREQIEAAISVGRAFSTPTCAHILNYDALRICVEAGITCVEHGYDMDDEIARMMVERGTWYVPTTVVTLMESTHIKPTNRVEEELVEKAAAAQIRARKALKVAIRNGVKMGVGTDTGCPYTNPSTYAYATELWLYSISGMSNEEILKCATIHSAELLGIDNITGTLEAGKKADVVVLDGDPLADITCAKNVVYTFCKGKLLYHSV